MSPNKPNKKAAKRSRELQFERFLAVVEENGNPQLPEDFLTAFSEIVKPVRPARPCEVILVPRETHFLRGFWMPIEGIVRAN